MGNSWQYRYDTGWINRSDWTNVHLGSDTTKNTDSNVTHNLNVSLANLRVEVLISTDGTDANSFICNVGTNYAGGTLSYGYTVYQIDSNNIQVQTGVQGFAYNDTAGAIVGLDTEDWYYKVKVWYLG